MNDRIKHLAIGVDGKPLKNVKIAAYASGSGVLNFNWIGEDEKSGGKPAFAVPTREEIEAANLELPEGFKLITINKDTVAIGPVIRINETTLGIEKEGKIRHYTYDPKEGSLHTEFTMEIEGKPMRVQHISTLARLRYYLRHEAEILAQK